MAEKYEPQAGKFTCLDGSATMDFSRVNDDTCDCPDGSDEPGTPACSNAVFYCRNRGHEPKLMSTSFVDDGVCDCCDGSDELDGCSNTCIEKNAAVREGLKQKVEDYKRALDKRREYAGAAEGHKQHMHGRLATIDDEIANMEQDVQNMAARKAELESTAEERKAARLEKRRQEEEERKERERQEKEARAAAEAEAAAKAEAEAAAAAAAAAEAGAASGGDAEQQGEDKEETAEERGRRIAAQWTNDPEAAGKAASEASSSSSDGEAAEKPAGEAEEGKGWLHSTWSKLKDAVLKPKEDEGGPDTPANTDDDWDKATCEEPTCFDNDNEAGDGGATEAGEAASAPEADRDEELEGAVTAFTNAEEGLAALRAEKELLQRQVTYDYGADDAWLALSRHCSDARLPHYTYRVCLFDKATQVDNGAGHVTNLGKWRGFEKGYTEGVFDNGDWCQQAPARSLRVHFECGLTERAWDASEPSVCAYAAHMATPAACKEEELGALEAKLAELIKEEEDLAREIREEEEARRAAFKAHAAASQAGRDEL